MNLIRDILYTLRQFGIDPIKSIESIRNLPRYFLGVIKFVRLKPENNISFLPSLNDFRSEAGSADGHYFWQDLICAKWIYDAKPMSHADIGSRIDGFISSLLVFRSVDLIDIRKLKNSIPNLNYKFGDIQSGFPNLEGKYDSVSSLHSIEHFGLGRYGDRFQVDGHEIGLRNISDLLKKEGSLYISFPIGNSKIQFNSQRIIHPLWPLSVLKNFTLEKFVLIPWKGDPVFDTTPTDVKINLKGQAGLYHFKKN
jgi:SAM-dependent methyltransferase